MNVVNHVLKDVTTYRVTSPFGMRRLTIGGKTIDNMHNGIDLTPKSDVIAIARGKVILVVSNVKESQTSEIIAKAQTSLYYGNVVYLQHNNGQVTRYAHLQYGTVKVQVGQIVEKGQVLGHMGTTGYSTGIHLHFEVLENGKRVDPAPYLLGQKQVSDFNESVVINRDGVPMIKMGSVSVNFRDKPNGVRLGTFDHDLELVYLGKSDEIGGYEWAEVIHNGKIVYCAINPLWNKITVSTTEIIKEVQVIKEVVKPINEVFERNGLKVSIQL